MIRATLSALESFSGMGRQPMTDVCARASGRHEGIIHMNAFAARRRWDVPASDTATDLDTASAPLETAQRYELCFHALEDQRCAFAFPCDAFGRVDLDALSDQARHDYLYARAMIGRILARPAVRTH
jgi:hypothetical protein